MYVGNGTFGENVQVSFDPEEGVVILIHDDAGRVLFRSVLMMYKGFQSGQKIKVSDIVRLRARPCTSLAVRLQLCDLEVFDERREWHEALEKAGLCFELEGQTKFKTHPEMSGQRDVTCQSFSWEALNCVDQEFEVRFNMSGSRWYGASQVHEQLWPIDQWTLPYHQFINTLSVLDEFGGVMHRYFLSSSGKAVTVEWDVPLWVSFNSTGDSTLRLKGSYKNSKYDNFDNSPLYFNYTECSGRNMKHIHQFMVKHYLGKPDDIPDPKLFRHPVWQVRAKDKMLTQEQVLSYASNLTRQNFSHSQLEIGDKWEREYGRLTFDVKRFPTPKNMTKQLSDMGLRTTLWVHPFVELTSDVLIESTFNMLLVRDVGGLLPGLTRWWNGIGAILDVTYNKTVAYLHQRLQRLRDDLGISSFKFDAGETNWLPAAYRLAVRTRNPSRFSHRYALAAFEFDKNSRNLDVRVGARTQHLPIFVRMTDRKSTWSHAGGLRSVIPTALTFSILGYPFILPDIIGGGSDWKPPRELYIRWVEANALLPCFQFSTPPWEYDDDVITITRRMLHIHEQFADVITRLAEEATETGDPIVRPMWWNDFDDEETLAIDSQFLLGNDILVAPVLHEHATSRDIYLPSGTWHDHLRGDDLPGSQWLIQYNVELHELAYFTRVT